MATQTVKVGSYNMSFAGDSGLDPRRAGVFESEGAFHLSNESGDPRLYWKNALMHLKSFWQSGGAAAGLQEMNLTAPGSGTGSDAVNTVLKEVDAQTETDTLQCQGGAKPSMTIAWRKNVFGEKVDSKVYDLDYMHVEPLVVEKATAATKAGSLKQAGRPIQLLLTDKNMILVNIHAPNNEFASEETFADFKKGFQDKVNQFLADVPAAAAVNPSNVIVMGDFNDRYDALQELPLTIGENTIVLRYQGQAPLSCCHNWDSSCSAERFVSKGIAGRPRAGTCKVPEYKKKHLNPGGHKQPWNVEDAEGDVATEGTGKPPNQDNTFQLAGPGKRILMGAEGTLANYRYTGDKIFAAAPASDLVIFKAEEPSSTRSDHEMVMMEVSVPVAAGGRRKARKGSKKTKKNKKQQKKNKSRKH